MRALCALLLLAAVAAAEYAPKPGQIGLYTWTVTQSAQWSSAGDKLRFDTEIAWKLALRCAAVDGPRMRLAATFVSVHATHRGPGVDAVVDSESGAGVDDALLGHLIAQAGKTLTMEVDRATGAVASVAGGDDIIAAINKRTPAAIPGDPPPLDAAARVVYGPDALARQWSQILALPGDKPTQVALPPPFAAGSTAARTWSDHGWSVSLPADAPPLAFEMSRDPSPVRGEVRNLTGSGSIALAQGLPAHAAGNLSFTLVMQALTQPVESAQTVAWKLDAQ